MSRLNRTLLEAIIAIASIALTWAVINSPAVSGRNCGGNSAALSDMRYYELIASNAAAGSPDHRFCVTSATSEQREQLAFVTQGRNSNARYLASTSPYPDPPGTPRRIIMVCERSFTNVPPPLLWPSPPAHAVAFSDGTVGLISVADFEALDRSTLKPMDELLAASKP